MESLERSIYGILAFFDLFDHPLTLSELEKFVSVSQNDILACISSSDKISHLDGFYFLKGREAIVSIRKSHFLHQEKLWRKVRRFVFLFRWVPFVKMLAVCNRLAYSAARPASDIDFFVVTKSGRLFLARAFFMFFLAIFGIRLHGGKMPGKFCLSFLVSEDAINFEPIRLRPQDVYLAYWSATLCPLFGHEIYRKFLSENLWLREFFSVGISENKDFSVSQFSFFRKILEFLFGGKIGDFFEKKLADWQMTKALKKWYALRKPAGIVISKTMLKFHEPDLRRKIQDRWEEKMKIFSEILK